MFRFKHMAIATILLLLLPGCFVVPFVEPDAQARGESCSACKMAKLERARTVRVSSNSGHSTQSKLNALLAQLESQKEVDRAHAAFWLGELKNSLAVESLVLHLKDSSKWVRRASAKALGKIGDARALKPLQLASRDKDQFVSESARNALRGMVNQREARASFR